MQIPFQTSQPDASSERQAELNARAEAIQAEILQIEHDRHMRRGDPSIVARDAVISEIRQLEKEIDQFREKQQELRYRFWQFEEKSSRINDVAELSEIVPQKANLTTEVETIEGEIKKREREIEYKGQIARSLLDAFDSLQYRRKQLLTRLSTSSQHERPQIERELQKVINRLRRFDSTDNPLWPLAISIFGGDA